MYLKFIIYVRGSHVAPGAKNLLYQCNYSLSLYLFISLSLSLSIYIYIYGPSQWLHGLRRRPTAARLL
jgi:hypothetical protein